MNRRPTTDTPDGGDRNNTLQPSVRGESRRRHADDRRQQERRRRHHEQQTADNIPPVSTASRDLSTADEHHGGEIDQPGQKPTIPCSVLVLTQSQPNARKRPTTPSARKTGDEQTETDGRATGQGRRQSGRHRGHRGVGTPPRSRGATPSGRGTADLLRHAFRVQARTDGDGRTRPAPTENGHALPRTHGATNGRRQTATAEKPPPPVMLDAAAVIVASRSTATPPQIVPTAPEREAVASRRRSPAEDVPSRSRIGDRSTATAEPFALDVRAPATRPRKPPSATATAATDREAVPTDRNSRSRHPPAAARRSPPSSPVIVANPDAAAPFDDRKRASRSRNPPGQTATGTADRTADSRPQERRPPTRSRREIENQPPEPPPAAPRPGILDAEAHGESNGHGQPERHDRPTRRDRHGNGRRAVRF